MNVEGCVTFLPTDVCSIVARESKRYGFAYHWGVHSDQWDVTNQFNRRYVALKVGLAQEQQNGRYVQHKKSRPTAGSRIYVTSWSIFMAE